MGLISIQDKSVSNPLFSGNLMYVQAQNFKMSGSNVVKTTNKTAQPTYTVDDGTGSTKFIKAYNRKKVQAQYSAFANPTISVDFIFKYDERTMSTRLIKGAEVNMLLLADLLHLVMTPKTYYLKEDAIIGVLSTGNNPYYSTYGIPVVVNTWSIEPVNGTNDVVVSLTFNETIDEFI